MRLDELIATDAPGASAAVEITGLTYDSRKVRAGDLFFCVSGFQSDGHEFAPEAVEAGAAALVVERPLGLGVPELMVESARDAMAPLAARFYGDPSRELRVAGVTGTNGKTTTAYLLKALFEATGEQCGLLGTVKAVVGGLERPVARTTPEAIDLQADFRAMLDGGDEACAMEVSSHALALGRADGIHFSAAVFTNISRDHLDFHETMEDYFQAKRRLFEALPEGSVTAAAAGAAGDGRARSPGVSVVNVGDPYGQRLAAEIENVRTFAVQQQGSTAEPVQADYVATDVRCTFEGCSFTLHTAAGERDVALPMPGRFNVANALGALAAVHALGGELDVLVAALGGGARVPGRFEPVDEGQDFAVLVDYAHTPDSLENVLAAARELAVSADERRQGRVICVFGAGGDRDRGKRPLMGEIAARLADVAVVTSDNPRSEEPEQIIAEIMAGVALVDRSDPAQGGVASQPPVRSIADRGEAIAKAIADARAGDVVVIAGKGHEQGQELAGGRKVPFDDVAVARGALRALNGSVGRASA